MDGAPAEVVCFSPGRYVLNSAQPLATAFYLLDTGLPPSVYFVPRGE
jgi:hypothetical protein